MPLSLSGVYHGASWRYEQFTAKGGCATVAGDTAEGGYSTQVAAWITGDRNYMRSTHVNVVIDLDRVRASAEAVRAKTGVTLIAVIKADAYGLGAARVADALDSIADEFAYFSLEEAAEVGRPGLVMGPPLGEPREYQERQLRPTVSTREQATHFVGLSVAVNVDTGMQRFGCMPEELDELLTISSAKEMFTHTAGASGAGLLRELRGGRDIKLHAASSAQLDLPDAWLDAVRPGYALYRQAVRVTGKLMAVRQTSGQIGYKRFEHRLIGMMRCGYAHGLRAAPAVINGRRQRILESGMNTCTISVDPADRAGDEVVLLGRELPEEEIAKALNCRPHEVLCRYTELGNRTYV